MHSRGRGVTSVWQTQGKLSHQNAMLAKQCALQIIAGMACQIFSSRRKNTWVVACKYTIVHTTQCTTRPVMMRMKCTCECSFVHAGGRAADTGRLALWNLRLQKAQSISIASLFNVCTYNNTTFPNACVLFSCLDALTRCTVVVFPLKGGFLCDVWGGMIRFNESVESPTPLKDPNRVTFFAKKLLVC